MMNTLPKHTPFHYWAEWDHNYPIRDGIIYLIDFVDNLNNMIHYHGWICKDKDGIIHQSKIVEATKDSINLTIMSKLPEWIEE